MLSNMRFCTSTMNSFYIPFTCWPFPRCICSLHSRGLNHITFDICYCHTDYCHISSNVSQTVSGSVFFPSLIYAHELWGRERTEFIWQHSVVWKRLEGNRWFFATVLGQLMKDASWTSQLLKLEWISPLQTRNTGGITLCIPQGLIAQRGRGWKAVWDTFRPG